MENNDYDNDLLRIEVDTLRKRINELLIDFQKVNKSRDKYMQLSSDMRSVIIEMLLSSTGWVSGKDIDKLALDVLSDYKRNRYGYD